MKLTRERKIFVGVLGVALAAFLVDQATVGGSGVQVAASGSAVASAEGSPATLLLAGAVTTGTSSGNVSAGRSAAAVDGSSLAQRFNLAAGTVGTTAASAASAARSNVRDLFRAPAKWSQEIEITSAELARAAAEQFAKSHRLSAVAHNGGSAVAVVDGKLLHVGASMDGFKLTAIGRDAAEFSGPAGATARLALKAEAVR